MAKLQYKDKISNYMQLGGIETSVLDNGPQKGVRIAWVNTGTGLRYKIVLDRAMDIVDAFYNQHSLAFISHPGIIAPRPDSDRGIEWLYTFAGGLMTTCGLSNIGAPQPDKGLHGRISNIPAYVESIVQPDIRAGKLDFSITGVMKESSLFRPQLELKRTISGTLGKPEIVITDTVSNVCNVPVEHMLLYHCNFGYPLLDEGSEIFYKGKAVSRAAIPTDDEIFASKHNCKLVPAPMSSHKGFGEACGFIDPVADKKGMCQAGIRNKKLGLSAFIEFNKKQLPCLTNWQHFGNGEFVVGLEPGTNPPIGIEAAKKQKSLIMLKPNQSRQYNLKISVIEDKKNK